MMMHSSCRIACTANVQQSGVRYRFQKIALRKPVTRLLTKATSGEDPFVYNIHGRHVDVTPELEDYVKTKFSKTLEKLYAADYLEAEGGVQEIDVRLMNSKADISVKPAKQNKALHDTYLRMGQLKAEGQGRDVYESFDRAAETLDKKLHKWSKATPQRKDLRNIGQSYRASAGPTGPKNGRQG